ncbi:MAG TPA: hypothetical protein VJ752_07795 [Burkholderiaceae bacterium]|nr:hypothetical protein [Burkholderiaceae bacterium]
MQPTEPSVPADLYLARTDEHCRDVVDRGILVQASFNTVCAIEYLKSHNIQPHIIERVLLHPEQRRKSHH